MKKITMLLFLSLALYACTRTGFPGVSRDIEESKDMGVFVAEYRAHYLPLDSTHLDITVKEAWLEKLWRHRFIGFSIDEKVYQLCIKVVDESSIAGLNDQWHIGRSKGEWVTQHGKDIIWIGDFKKTDSDTISLEIFSGEYTLETNRRPTKPIGMLVLTK